MNNNNLERVPRSTVRRGSPFKDGEGVVCHNFEHGRRRRRIPFINMPPLDTHNSAPVPVPERDRVFHVGHEDVLIAIRRSSTFVIDMTETFEQRLREMTVAFLEEYPLDPVLIANTMFKAATVINETVGDDARDLYDVQEPYYRAVRVVKVEEPSNAKSPELMSEVERAIFGGDSSESEGLLSCKCAQSRAYPIFSQYQPVSTRPHKWGFGVLLASSSQKRPARESARMSTGGKPPKKVRVAEPEDE